MKKIAAALALAGACVVSNAAIVRWDVAGTSENIWDSSLYIDTFVGYMLFDTKKFAANAGEGQYQAGVLEFGFTVTPGFGGVGGSCGGNHVPIATITTDRMYLNGVNVNTDCMMGITLTGLGIGASGPFADESEALARTFDLLSPNLKASVYMFGSNGHPSVEVTSITQRVNGRVVASTDPTLIPEPATLALAGLAGLGVLATRRRRPTA